MPRTVIAMVTRFMSEDFDQIKANQLNVLMGLAPGAMVQFKMEWEEGMKKHREEFPVVAPLENMEVISQPVSLKESDDEYKFLVRFDGTQVGAESNRLKMYKQFLQRIWDLGGIAGEFKVVEA